MKINIKLFLLVIMLRCQWESDFTQIDGYNDWFESNHVPNKILLKGNSDEYMFYLDSLELVSNPFHKPGKLCNNNWTYESCPHPYIYIASYHGCDLSSKLLLEVKFYSAKKDEKILLKKTISILEFENEKYIHLKVYEKDSLLKQLDLLDMHMNSIKLVENWNDTI